MLRVLCVTILLDTMGMMNNLYHWERSTCLLHTMVPGNRPRGSEPVLVLCLRRALIFVFSSQVHDEVHAYIWLTVASSVHPTPNTARFLATTLYFHVSSCTFLLINILKCVFSGFERHCKLFRLQCSYKNKDIMKSDEVSVASDVLGWRCLLQFASFYFFWLKWFGPYLGWTRLRLVLKYRPIKGSLNLD